MGIRALLLEDDDFTRLSLEAALSSAGISVVASCATPSDAISKAQTTNPDVAVLDLHLGSGPTGIDVARVLRRQNLAIGLVILTSFEDPRLLDIDLPKPPAGTRYLVKRDVKSLAVLVAEIEAAINPSAKPAHHKPSPLENLTDTQVETLKYVAEGLSNAEIAKRRFVTAKSIETTLSRVAKALDIEYDQTQNQRVQIAKVYFQAIGQGPSAQND